MAEENPDSQSEVPDSDAQDSETLGELLDKAKIDLQAIEEIKTTIELYAEDLTSLKESAESDSKASQTAMEESEKSKESATENADAVQENKTAAGQLLLSIQKERDDAIALLETIKKHEANTKLIADIAEEKDQRVEDYEEQLKDLTTEYSQLKKQIEDLLPGATSAGLASAFETRKNSFRWPKRLWALLQIVSVFILMGMGYLVFKTTQIDSFADLIFFIFKRSPIIAAIIFLEEIARRNRNIALRLEEDYGYKEVLSRSFEGYKKQMEEIDQQSNMAVSTLSTNLLIAMAKEPGRLIDKEKPIIKPTADVIEDVMNKLKKNDD
ncbi:hypothetical protein LCGC14_1808650 [marine sediment metagenome]|uniref:Uncharacterized protein n=1 Tax=marine sediment metagenome TaxID=412755 RepID=A0A0F9HAH6_9ZZZZ